MVTGMTIGDSLISCRCISATVGEIQLVIQRLSKGYLPENLNYSKGYGQDDDHKHHGENEQRER